ncbi:hypothetical protein BD626DRAFT_502476 [Schizophyllum amplum]|uniref:Uncharacterized protein n=1 Tax=Schizophyllum amplum TaxID=97359 RepID=A0A550C8A4_9AGAR|nr:hypothetical protein BD626DRAFT_502476 [Auriculariopsis ampla]
MVPRMLYGGFRTRTRAADRDIHPSSRPTRCGALALARLVCDVLRCSAPVRWVAAILRGGVRGTDVSIRRPDLACRPPPSTRL